MNIAGNIDGTTTIGDGQSQIQLSKECTLKLIRWAVNQAHLVQGEPLTGPFVITADLDYSDFDNDQDTKSYHWNVAVGERSLADDVLAAMKSEIKCTIFKECEMPSIPELNINTTDIELVKSVAAALTSLRIQLFKHSSDSVADDSDYWENFGFSEAECGTISECLDPYMDYYGEPYMDYDGQLTPTRFLEFAAVNVTSGTKNRFYDRLKAWINGKSIEEVKTIPEEEDVEVGHGAGV